MSSMISQVTRFNMAVSGSVGLAPGCLNPGRSTVLERTYTSLAIRTFPQQIVKAFFSEAVWPGLLILMWT